jgi:hypothetical protein
MTAFWGISNNGGAVPSESSRRATLESQLGKFNSMRRNLHFGHKFPLDDISLAQQGYMVYRNQDSVNKLTNPDTLFAFADIAKGLKDSYLKAGFAAIAASGQYSVANPYLFSYHHEQQVNESWQPRPPGTPADFIAAVKHVRQLLDDGGYSLHLGGDIALVFNTLQSQWLNPALTWYIEKCDAGPDVVDVYGGDYYNKRNQPNSTALHYGTVAFDSIEPLIQYAKDRGRPWGLQEFSIEGGTAAQEQEKADWLDSFTSLIDEMPAGMGPGELMGLWWTDEGSETSPGRPVTSSVVLAAMMRLKAAAYQAPSYTVETLVVPPPQPLFPAS